VEPLAGNETGEAASSLRWRCRHCGGKLEARQRAYCCDAHRARGYRRRQAGLPENRYPNGGSRGQLALAQLTRAQARLRLLELRQTAS